MRTKESDDLDIIAAATAKPGVVLRRAVGSDGSFGEHAQLPTNLGDGAGPTKAVQRPKGSKTRKTPGRPVDKAADRKAAATFANEQKRREREREREEAVKQKERERRQQAIDKAQAALDKAKLEHAKKAAAIQVDVEAWR